MSKKIPKKSNFSVSQIEPVVIHLKDPVRVDSWPKFEKERPTRTRDTAYCFPQNKVPSEIKRENL